LIDDSGGRGRYRGGLGFRRTYRILQDGVQFATYSDRFNLPAQGVFGGEPGRPASMTIHRGEETISLPSKCGAELQRNDLLVVCTGGGGGYGRE
jgi:N-methylhydantoinase B